MAGSKCGSLALILVALPVVAQQSGALAGKLTSRSGAALAGIQIQATSSVLPLARAGVSGPNGEFRLPHLPPGEYTVVFTHPAWATAKRTVQVRLQQTTPLELMLGEAALPGAVVEVVGQGGPSSIPPRRNSGPPSLGRRSRVCRWGWNTGAWWRSSLRCPIPRTRCAAPAPAAAARTISICSTA